MYPRYYHLEAVLAAGVLLASLAARGAPHAPAAVEEPPTVVVTGTRVAVPDADLVVAVGEALAASPVLYSAHVTITVRNGVVTLHGIVFDEWDLRIAERIAHRLPGVRRVINDTELKLGGSD